tara:strand:+ start:179 stop:409 length:231 start_codon:yes stop_codon:yes gene_type:complete
MINIPIITDIPRVNSYILIFFLKNNGSIIDTKNDEDDKQHNDIETFDIFIASKNDIQCNAIIIPTTYIFNFSLLFK